MAGVGAWEAGETEEAVKALGLLRERGDLENILCVLLGCICGESEELSRRLEVSMETASNFAIIHGAFWAWVATKYRVAKWILSHLKDKKITPVHGWLDLAAGRFEQAKQVFEWYLLNPTDSNDVLALYGQAVAYAELEEFPAAIQVYTKIVSYYDFEEVRIEKARIYFHMRLWEMAFDSLTSAHEKQCSPLEVQGAPCNL